MQMHFFLAFHFCIILYFKEAGFFFLHLFYFFFFLHLSCLQFLFVVAIHGQICVACTILTGGGGMQMHLFAFICIFEVSTCIPRPPPH